MYRRIAALSLALACATTAVAGLTDGPARAATEPAHQTVEITARDGVVLKAVLTRPSTPGPHPLVIMPSAWGGASGQNNSIAESMADRGFVFLGYATRGFVDSGGTVDAGGPQSVSDARVVLDWALRHVSVTRNGVGFIGQSLAAGIALIAAAEDPRIRAIGIVSGGGSLKDAIDQNDTPTDLVSIGVITSGLLNGRLSPETQKIFKDLLTHTDRAAVDAWLKVRSPATYLAGLNRNKPAIFFASGENETVFPTGQTVDFFTRLTGPRTLQLRPGDHGTAEGSATQGDKGNVVFRELFDWLGSYLGPHPGPRDRSDVEIFPESASGLKPAERSASWSKVSAHAERYELGAKGLTGTATLGGRPAAWTNRIVSGFDTPANIGIPLVTYGLEAFTGAPPTTIMPTISRLNAGVWQSTPLRADRRIRGRAQLHVGIRPSTAAGTVIAYLYDVDPTGTIGYMIGGVPYTWSGRTPGVAFGVDLRFQALGYDVPRGHRLAVVIDTKDVLFHDRTTTGAPLAFTSTANDPAHLDLPLR